MITAPSRGESSRIERMDSPAPGTYWRLRDEFEGRHDDRCQANSMPAGTVLLLSSIKFADGDPHAYVFEPHPGLETSRQVKAVFHADDFYLYWEPEPNGEAIRAKELADLLSRMESTKTLMLSTPPDAVPAGLLTHNPSEEVGGAGQALATIDSIEAMTLFTDRMQEDAEARSQWIKTHSGALAEQGSQMARFHGERAQAAMARATSQLEGVKGILKTVANLRIYTGAGVSLTPLRDGEPAAYDAPLTVYQEVLSLDEETLILLDDGGLDHTRVDALAEALSDPDLINRMVPSERGMVLCRFRNSYKEFFKGDDMAAGMANAQYNEASQQVLLLVRDGQRVSLVQIEGVLAGMKQLLPSQGEQSSYFTDDSWRGKGKRITREDLAYAEAQRKQIGMLDQYGRVLIALWGLHDREGLFDGSHIPRFSNWLDPGFQSRFMALVSLDNMLGVTRPSFGDWQRQQNKYLANGVWAAVDLRQACGQEFLPGAYSSTPCYTSRGYEYSRTYDIDLPGKERAFIGRVKKDAVGLYLGVPLVYAPYTRGTPRRMTGKLYLSTTTPGRADSINNGVLVLDRARNSDLDYYLTSRKERRGYASYIALFREGRKWAAARDTAEQPIRDYLVRAVTDAGMAHDPDTLPDLVTDAVAVARTSRRDGVLPASDAPGYRAVLKGALATLHALLTNNESRVEHISRWAVEMGREPLRLALSGKDRWLLYLVPIAAEHDSRLGEPAHATLAEVSFAGAGVEVAVTGRSLLRAVAGEQVIHDWNVETVEVRNQIGGELKIKHVVGAASWSKKTPDFKLPYAKAVEALTLPREGMAAAEEKLNDLHALVLSSRLWMRKHSKGTVISMLVRVPVGTLLCPAPSILLAEIDALDFAWQRGDQAVRDQVMQVIDGIYADPSRRVKKLGSSVWKGRGVEIDGAIKCAPDFEKLGAYRSYYVTEGCCIRPGSDPSKKSPRGAEIPTIRVTGVTPLGVELMPWLVGVTEAAM